MLLCVVKPYCVLLPSHHHHHHHQFAITTFLPLLLIQVQSIDQ